MNKGVQILLERMDSNPDEFGYDDPMLSRKWRDITEQISQRYQSIVKNPEVKSHWQYALDFLTDEEIVALHDKLKALRADEFTRDVMGRLLSEADDQSYDSSDQRKTANVDAARAQMEIELLKAQAQHNNSIARVFGSGK